MYVSYMPLIIYMCYLMLSQFIQRFVLITIIYLNSNHLNNILLITSGVLLFFFGVFIVSNESLSRKFSFKASDKPDR